jgi:lipopolysaccharide/colanic/teichoic acid biosynthesis glycosyltransferase
MSIQAVTPEITPLRRVIRSNAGNESQADKKLTFFYIGTDDSMGLLFSGFVAGRKASDFASAEEFLSAQAEEDLPDAIFIDVPLQASPLKSFCSFLKKNEAFSSIPVIYSLTQLMKSRMAFSNQMKLIEKAGCIDDILDLNRHTINYSSKIGFLRQARINEHAMEACRKKNMLHFKKRSFFLLIKRGVDILLASLAIILLAPFFIIIAIAIKLESRGPVFYNAPRAGRCFKIFKFYKFRTMVNNADKKIEALAHMNQYDGNEAGPKFFKIVNDPRVTRLGKFLRNSSLDELPQLFNVIKGDMSIVGNRPLPLYEAETLTTDEFMERFNAPAGITGLWQVKKRGNKDMSVEERINLDISYARNTSWLMDVGIIARTPMALFQKSNV